MLSFFAQRSLLGKRATACVFASAALCVTMHAENFDKPLRTTVVNLGNSPGVRPIRPIELTCWYYPEFVVKQLDDPALKGADWITVIPAGSDHLPCKRSHEAGERYLSRDRTEYLGGYFKGVKDQLVFLDSADGTNGGIFFVAYDWKSGRPIFQDSALFWNGHDLRSDPQNNVQFSRTSDGKLVLHYRRVVVIACSIPLHGLQCWRQVRHKFHLPPSAMPKCSGYRYPGAQEWTAQNPSVLDELDAESVFAYPVETILDTRPMTKALAGRITCSAVD